MPELIIPTVRLRDSWLAARDDWGRGTHQDGSGLFPTDDIESSAGFEAWVQRLRRESDESFPVPDGRVHATYWWIVEDGEVQGSISLRHRLNDFLFRAGGHIGYGVRPSARKRGLATWALGEVLPHARKRGLDRVLLTCADDNTASARVIEHHGGVLEELRETEIGLLRRYWIDLAA